MKAVAGEEPSEAERAAQMRKVRREIVDLHGEMVLLLNYSAVNYTGLFHLLWLNNDNVILWDRGSSTK